MRELDRKDLDYCGQEFFLLDLNMVIWAMVKKSFREINFEIVFQNDSLDNKKLEEHQAGRERKSGRLKD